MFFERKNDEKIGELLIKRGTITRDNLNKALEIQKTSNAVIGDILIKMGVVSDADIVQALIDQYGFPFINTDSYDINAEAVKCLGGETAVKCECVPLDLIGEILVIAIANPLDKGTISELEKTTNKKIRTFIGLRSDILGKIKKIY
ncbi:MAG: hypothetical protein HQL28_00425 [Candidatus Omnitrophica bacterium]|nr:hypothetical protein [Candidatus Omnitrophota bacterium]